MSQAAACVEPAMLVVTNLEHASPKTILFQRATVIVSDGVLLAAAYCISRRQPSRHAALTTFFLVAANAGLLLVDHIHFQYNGVMLGILLWSIYAASQGQELLSGVLFAALLNMKHLFAYAGPVYFVYLLRHYCRGPHGVQRFLLLGASVVAVCAASFGPFIRLGQMQQVMARLFPFGRGLCHAYWAANFWALYGFADKCFAVVAPLVGVRIEHATANMAGGLVGTARFAVLPQVPPAATMVLVMASLLPCLVALWHRPAPERFPLAVAYSYLCGFVFGYHVHEKAILMAIILLAITATRSPRHARRFVVLSSAGHYALLPLLFEPKEYGIKMLLVLLYFGVTCWALASHHCRSRGVAAIDSGRRGTGGMPRSPDAPGPGGGSSSGIKSGSNSRLVGDSEHMEDPALGAAGTVSSAVAAKGSDCDQAGGTGLLLLLRRPLVVYLAGLPLLWLYCDVLHPAVPLLSRRLPFLPLMLTSVYCALGVLWVWGGMALDFIMDVDCDV